MPCPECPSGCPDGVRFGPAQSVYMCGGSVELSNGGAVDDPLFVNVVNQANSAFVETTFQTPNGATLYTIGDVIGASPVLIEDAFRTGQNGGILSAVRLRLDAIVPFNFSLHIFGAAPAPALIPADNAPFAPSFAQLANLLYTVKGLGADFSVFAASEEIVVPVNVQLHGSGVDLFVYLETRSAITLTNTTNVGIALSIRQD